MMVLSRRVGDLILIGDHTLVRVLGIKSSVVRLGLEAPADVPILRGELRAFDKAGHPPIEADVSQARPPKRAHAARNQKTVTS